MTDAYSFFYFFSASATPVRDKVTAARKVLAALVSATPIILLYDNNVNGCAGVLLEVGNEMECFFVFYV